MTRVMLEMKFVNVPMLLIERSSILENKAHDE